VADRPTVGKYILGERLAAGGMAELFRAEPVQGRFDGPIVLKRMLPALASEPDFVSMFIEEARISTHLDHPNIVKVHDFDASDHGLFLVMEMVDGPDLLAVLGHCAKLDRALPPEIAAYIACHVLEALDYAHRATSPTGGPLRVVHRDVSPSNILITRRGHVKLADFGIARASSLGRTREIAQGTLKGKFGYMSPEQVRGEALDGRSDVWSMAIVLAEMLMAKRLFTAPDDFELLLMVRRGDLSRLDEYGKHIPRSLDAIIRKALSVDLDQRYASAGEFRDALADFLANSRRRTGASHLAALLRELEREAGALCSWSPAARASTSAVTISGTQTRHSRRAASEAAELGRIEFANADPLRAPTEPPAPPRARPQRAVTSPPQGALTPGRVVDLLCGIARDRRTGALLVQHGEHLKEAWFHQGHPVFVASTVPEDRFGEFLVRRGLLERNHLDRVLAILDRFQGRMGQALVSLGLIDPVDAVRLLAAQVAAKLITACDWHDGTYEFRENEQNPWPALTLELSTFAIVGKSLSSLPVDRLVAWIARWADRAADLRTDRLRPFDLDAASTDKLLPLAGGHHTLRQVIDALPTPQERLHITAIAYVLWRCGVLRLAV
jgi:serine/threonine protein kinase